jgi:hypothetical protein
LIVASITQVSSQIIGAFGDFLHRQMCPIDKNTSC